MGLFASWALFENEPKDALFRSLGVEETGEEGHCWEVSDPYSFLELPDGRIVLFCKGWGLADSAQLELLSRGRTVLACAFQDKVGPTWAVLAAARDRELLWRIATVGNELTITGDPPPELEPIRKRREAQIDPDSCVAVMYEIAFDLGEALCGFHAMDNERSMWGLRVLPGSPINPRSFVFDPEPDTEPPLTLGQKIASRLVLVVWTLFATLAIVIKCSGV